MFIKRYVSKTANLFAENKLLKFVVVILALVDIYNYSQVQKALHYQKTILVPPIIESKIEVSAVKYSSSYLKAMGTYLTTLFLDFTPETVVGQYIVLSQFLDPFIYPEKSKELDFKAKKYRDNGITSSVHIDKITLTIEDKKGEIKLNTKRILYVLDQPARREVGEVVIKYENKDGLFRIKEIKYTVFNKEDLIK